MLYYCLLSRWWCYTLLQMIIIISSSRLIAVIILLLLKWPPSNFQFPMSCLFMCLMPNQRDCRESINKKVWKCRPTDASTPSSQAWIMVPPYQRRRSTKQTVYTIMQEWTICSRMNTPRAPICNCKKKELQQSHVTQSLPLPTGCKLELNWVSTWCKPRGRRTTYRGIYF